MRYLVTLLLLVVAGHLSSAGCCCGHQLSEFSWMNYENAYSGPPKPPVVPKLAKPYKEILNQWAPWTLRRVEACQPLMMDDVYNMLALHIPAPAIIQQLMFTHTSFLLTQQDFNQMKLWGFPDLVIRYFLDHPPGR